MATNEEWGIVIALHGVRVTVDAVNGIHFRLTRGTNQTVQSHGKW